MEHQAMKITLSIRQAKSRRPQPAIRLAMLALSALLVFGGQSFVAQPQKAQASRQVPFPCSLTLGVTEGPFWRVGSPERSSLLEPGMVGARVIATGYVYDTNCQPIPNAWLDFWQANYDGQYDNTGYTLRGHEYADQSGHYQMQTIVPGEYPGRTIHIHMKVQAPGGPVLTTQIFFPDVAHNSQDGIFDPSLVVDLENTQNGKMAFYNFVVNTAARSPVPPATNSYMFRESGFTVP